jgi:PAS domain S-box-containing protein
MTSKDPDFAGTDGEESAGPSASSGGGSRVAAFQAYAENRRQAGRRESDRRFAALADYAPIGIFMNDVHGRATYLNSVCCNLLGMSQLAATGDGWARALHPEDRDRVREEWLRAVETRSHFQSIYRFCRRDGTTVWVEGQAAPITNEAGQIDGWVGTVQDVTAVWTARAEIQASNDRLRAVLDASPFAIISVDTQGRVTAWSKGATRMFGWAESEVLGNPSPKVPDDEKAAADDLLQRVLSGERVVSKIVYRRKKEGENVQAAISAAPLRTASGRISGAVLVAQDVTEIERSAELIQLLTAEREHIVQTLHDGCIQSIYAVGLNLEGCRQLAFRDPAVASDRIARAVADLNLVIHDLRASISRDGYCPHDESRPLRAEIERAIPPDSEVRFDVAIDETVERRLAPQQAAQLAHIARESISNILRHAGAHHAQVVLRGDETLADFEVRDDGNGFDAGAVAAQPHGLGMHHIHARVRKLGGQCAIASRPGQGTRIEIRIPLAP